jgi:membrane-associated phospholipid phosphatase
VTARQAARWAVPAALFAALAGLGAAVEEGALRGIDHFGYAHLQPLHRGDWSRLADLASPGVASVLMAIAAFRLRRDALLAAAWLAAFAAGVVMELVSKAIVVHPSRNPDAVPWLAHEGFPSGHAMRGLLVAGAMSAAWPRARGPLVAWAVANAVVVEVTRMHPVSEVVGGVIAGLALVTAVGAVRTDRRSLDTRYRWPIPGAAVADQPLSGASSRSSPGSAGRSRSRG